jgi:nicotinamide-nucleotide amidase
MYNTKEIADIKDYLLAHKESIAVAESVTSGHLQAAFSLADGATQFFQGGITAYNIGQKSRHLKIDPIHGIESNCVSPKIAREMALHTLELFSCNWSVAITGYAAPVPELNIHDRFAFYAIAHHNKIVASEKIEAFETDLYKVQVHYTNVVLQKLRVLLENIPKN